MKWTKFDPSNPPKYTPGKATFWLLRYSTSDHYTVGAYLHNQGLLEQAGDKVSKDIISPNRLLLYKAHWIYPQDLEMPE